MKYYGYKQMNKKAEAIQKQMDSKYGKGRSEAEYGKGHTYRKAEMAREAYDKAMRRKREKEYAATQQRQLEEQYPKLFKDKIGGAGYHSCILDILVNIDVGNLVFLVGPAGSGKTTIAMNVAEVLEKNFYFTGAVHQKHELLGFTDAKGETIRTPFREAYEHGGVFLFDEYDASSPHAITAFNAALSNAQCAFPDGIVKAHPDFIAIAAGNTYGTGATRQYVGRFQQDAASLDRFVFIEIDYDNELELLLAKQAYAKAGGTYEYVLYDYLIRVRKIRAAVLKLGIPHIVSPRATIQGVKLLAKGMKREAVENMAIFKGMNPEQRKLIESELSAKGSDKSKASGTTRTKKADPFSIQMGMDF